MVLRTCRNDAGSLPIAMLLVMVGTSLSAVIASTAVARTASVHAAVDSPLLLDAAHAGFETVIARIRAAVDNHGQGSRVALPCGPVSGRVAAAIPHTFVVTVAYKTVGDSSIGCLSGAGTLTVPAYADLTSTGQDPVTGGSRVLTARYSIRTSNQNIPGGLVPAVAKVAGQSVCLDAGSANPAAGAIVRLQLCAAGSRQQTFAYNENLYLTLVSSATDTLPLGMCLDGGPLPHPDSDVLVTMQPCAAGVAGRQQWSINDLNYYEGTSDGVNLDDHCLTPQAPDTVAVPVVVRKPCAYDYNPEVSVGAGSAGAKTTQVVNYGQFGRCLDVAEYNWQRAFFWIWPCKQAPSVAGLSWNQKWVLPAVVPGDSGTAGFIVNYPPSISYPACLRSPLATAQWSYVTLEQCPSAPATGAFKWTVFGDTGTYATSYTIVDDAGNCLAAADPTQPGGDISIYGHDVSPAVTVVCSGSTREKWNADPNVLKASPLTMVAER
jgi:hypothetical protein